MDAKSLFYLLDAARHRERAVKQLVQTLTTVPDSLSKPQGKLHVFRRPEEKMAERLGNSYQELKQTYDAEIKAIADFLELFSEQLQHTYREVDDIFEELDANADYQRLLDQNAANAQEFPQLRAIINEKEQQFALLYYNLKTYDTRMQGVLSYSQNKLEIAHNNYCYYFAVVIQQHQDKIEQITGDKLNELKNDPSALSYQALKVLYSLYLYEQGNVVSSTPVADASNSGVE